MIKSDKVSEIADARPTNTVNKVISSNTKQPIKKIKTDYKEIDK